MEIKVVDFHDSKVWSVPDGQQHIIVRTLIVQGDMFYVIGSDDLVTLEILEINGWDGELFWKAFFCASFPKLRSIILPKKTHSWHVWAPRRLDLDNFLSRFASLRHWGSFGRRGIAMDLRRGFQLSNFDRINSEFITLLIFQRLVMFTKRVTLALCYQKALGIDRLASARMASFCKMEFEELAYYPREAEQANNLTLANGFYPVDEDTFELAATVRAEYKRLSKRSRRNEEQKCLMEASGVFLQTLVQRIVKKPKLE